MAETQAPEGQVEAAPQGTTAPTPDGQATGQSAAPEQTTASGPDTGGTESFFDPESIKGKPELEAAYKQMQSAFTKKNQAFSEGQQKIEQYDQFMANPIETMKQIAQQYGMNVVEADPSADKPQQFQSWDDVMSEAKRQVMQELQPVLGEVQSMKKQNIESYFDNNHPDWRTYEDEMLGKLKEHPSLVQDPDLLYEVSIPKEIREGRAYKAALAKVQATQDSSKVQGQSSTTKQTTQPKRAESFQQAVEFARQDLAQRGLTAPRE